MIRDEAKEVEMKPDPLGPSNPLEKLQILVWLRLETIGRFSGKQGHYLL